MTSWKTQNTLFNITNCFFKLTLDHIHQYTMQVTTLRWLHYYQTAGILHNTHYMLLILSSVIVRVYQKQRYAFEHTFPLYITHKTRSLTSIEPWGRNDNIDNTTIEPELLITWWMLKYHFWFTWESSMTWNRSEWFFFIQLCKDFQRLPEEKQINHIIIGWIISKSFLKDSNITLNLYGYWYNHQLRYHHNSPYIVWSLNHMNHLFWRMLLSMIMNEVLQH